MISKLPVRIEERWTGLASRRLVTCCSAKAKKLAGNTKGKGFGTPTVTAPQPRRESSVQFLDDLPPVLVSPESNINEGTRDKCLFYMNKTEDLCDRLLKVFDQAWALATKERLEECVSRPVTLNLAGHSALLHILDVAHDDQVNVALLAAVWNSVSPSAVALDVPSTYTKSFTRMAKAMDSQLMTKLASAPLHSLTTALDIADDVDRLRWHHAILQVIGSGASPISVDESVLVNSFAQRGLYLSECIAAAHLAAVAGPSALAVPVHGIDMEDDSLQSALDEDDFWTEKDIAAYQQRLLNVAEPQLRNAAKTLLQGIPAGTAAALPRQRFILDRLSQALSRQQYRSFQEADSDWRLAHSEAKAQKQERLREQQAVHLLGQLRDIATGRLGGRKCERLLAVLGGGQALRVRNLLEAQI